MDTFEIMSTVRGYSGLKGQNDIGDLLLLRRLNMANMNVCQLLLPLFRQYLIKTITREDVTGTEITIPGDSLQIINIEREMTAATLDFKPGSPVAIEDKTIIGVNPDFVASATKPLYVDEGRKANVYPTMTTQDVRLTYRKRIADLIYNQVVSIPTSTTITLNTGASLSDDYYNDYYIALYEVSNGEHSLNGIHLITDYVGSTKVATITPATSLTTEEVHYSLVPILPEEYHNLLVDATLVELKKSGFDIRETGLSETPIDTRIANILGIDRAVNG